MEDDADGMDIDTADTSLTSSASKPKAKAKSKAFKSSGGSRPALPKKASSGGAGKILTMAQQEKVAEKAEAEERVVPWRFLKDVKDVGRSPFCLCRSQMLIRARLVAGGQEPQRLAELRSENAPHLLIRLGHHDAFRGPQSRRLGEVLADASADPQRQFWEIKQNHFDVVLVRPSSGPSCDAQLTILDLQFFQKVGGSRRPPALPV